ncbi:thrombospondin type-1 domain-containing protein 4 isoform X2 [Strongylocentrotus purpuratus]|uniref:CUB domain-containing protein n=1 Tax=Strongylocentrotus purpuratus TaxID=7668 RepID=A0A7M7P9W3_STRPU|nr:thrombospondin type-1 domain-containing protein 4 isoform X2 [Strongylocentrotus purpuratus]
MMKRRLNALFVFLHHFFNCPGSTQYQFAEEQCGSRDNILYKDQLTTWLPYTDRSQTSGDDFCQHNCVSYGLSKVVKFGQFTDGTRCDVLNPLEDKTAICVEGECKHFGCDLEEDSDRRFDSCGVCDGDNSTCEIQTGGVSHPPAYYDYTNLLEIPIGSTYINITQPCGDCHFALIIEDQYVIGGAGERGKSRAYSMGDDVISYVGGDGESIQIRGPTSSKITIQVYASTYHVFDDAKKSSEARWVFFKPIQDRPAYRWSIVDTPCSKTCGYGLQMQEVICTELGLVGTLDGRSVKPFHCLHLKKPEPVTEPCNEFDCPHRWEVGEWGDCSVSCGVGVRFRQAYCVRENTAGLIEILPHVTCADRLEPLLEEHCEAPACLEDVTCNKTIFASEGSFTSPNHPGNYPTDINCITRIKVNPGYWIDLTFQSFELEPAPGCIYDYVEVFQDREDGTRTSIARLCGTRKFRSSVVVKGNSASVLFHSDVIVTRRGFVANFSELDP